VSRASVERTLEQLQQILRMRLEPHRRVYHNQQRAEDKFRDEHHDAHAKTIRATNDARALRADASAAVVRSRNSNEGEGNDRRARTSTHMRIRIIKTPPAPMVDGFDMRGIRADYIYDVDNRTGTYLILAGYAVRADPEPHPAPAKR
jgi:hypothetical protein